MNLYRPFWLMAAISLGASMTTASAQDSQFEYHLTAKVPLPGDGRWDYVAFDTVGRRLFITRQDRVMVVAPDSGKVLGEITGLSGVHGVAFAYESGHGFITSGRDSSVTMFDLKTLHVLGKTTAAADADAILYDPASQRVFTFNGDEKSSTVIDPRSGRRIGTINLGTQPEFAVSAGDGKLYVNLTKRGIVAEIDATRLRIARQWSIAPCQSPSGLAIDRATHRLFSGCRNKVMAISDVLVGRLITTVPIGSGVDANVFDPGTNIAFSSNGDGTLTIVHEDSPEHFSVLQTVPTMPGARTMALDPKTHKIYLVTAQFGPQPTESTATNPRRRPPVVPGSFTLLVVSPDAR